LASRIANAKIAEERAALINSNKDLVTVELDKALLQRGEAKEAVQSLETAARLRPDESYVHYQLGRAYLAAGRKAEGEGELDLYKQLKDKVRNEPHK
jgi:Flp pilus assembly protein TadD